jgi:hypothetical protein
MDLDAISQHFFGTADIDTLSSEALEAGRERVSIAFGTERDAGRRFALWAVLRATGVTPLPNVAFKDAREIRAAEAYAAAIGFAERSDE